MINMVGIKDERMNLLSELNKSLINNNVDRALNIVEVLIANMKQSLGKEPKEDLEEFKRQAEEARVERVAEINERAESMTRVAERSNFKRINYRRAKSEYVRKLHNKLATILQEEKMIPE